MILRKWDYIHDKWRIVEIPKTGPEPDDWGVHPAVPVAEEETQRGFDRQIKLRGEKEYQRKIRRMKELGLIEQSNPGNIEQLYSGQFKRIGGWWSDLWKTLTGWIEDINKWVGPLIDLYKELEEAGIITHEQAEQAEAEGWTKEELISLIKAQTAPTWEKWLPWIIAGGVGVGLLAVLLRRPPVYIATK